MSSNRSADTFLPRGFFALHNLILVAAIVATQGVLSLSVQAGDATERHTAGAGIPPLDTTRVASGLFLPVFATYAPGDFSRLFILEKPGRIRILNLETGVLLATPFLNINSLVGGGNSTNDERGLLGLAFHPDYQDNGFFYVNYTNNSSDTTIRRYAVSGNPDLADSGSGSTLLTIDQPFSNHNGGWIGFGPQQVVGSGVSTLTQTYTITNNGDEAVEFNLVRLDDYDLLWVTDDFTDDVVGTSRNGAGCGGNYVYQMEDGHPETAITVSSDHPGVYSGSKGGLDPDNGLCVAGLCVSGGSEGDICFTDLSCAGPAVPWAFGTDQQEWDAGGVPPGWENKVAHVPDEDEQFNVNGESGPTPEPDDCSPCDGKVIWFWGRDE